MVTVPPLCNLRLTTDFLCMKKATILYLALLLLSGLAIANTSITRFVAVPASDRVYVRWSASVESNLVRYEVYRRVENESALSLVATVQPTGSGSSYEVADMNVARTSPMASTSPTPVGILSTRYTYILRIIGTSRIDEMQTSLVYQTSTTRRTWGSIKALFR